MIRGCTSTSWCGEVRPGDRELARLLASPGEDVEKLAAAIAAAR